MRTIHLNREAADVREGMNMLKHAARSVLFGVLALALLSPAMALARTFVVHPGESIRAALAKARHGDEADVLPGIYHEGASDDLDALTVTASGIALVGRSRPGRPVVLENAGEQSYGLWVSPADSASPEAQATPEEAPCAVSGSRLRGFALTGLTVRGFAQHGVHLACVDGFALAQNVSEDNDVYGLFPIFSTDGIISFNEVTMTGSDAGIYVGQSDRVKVVHNRVHDSLLGIEVQNSKHCSVVHNDVHDNTVGITAWRATTSWAMGRRRRETQGSIHYAPTWCGTDRAAATAGAPTHFPPPCRPSCLPVPEGGA